MGVETLEEKDTEGKKSGCRRDDGRQSSEILVKLGKVCQTNQMHLSLSSWGTLKKCFTQGHDISLWTFRDQLSVQIHFFLPLLVGKEL